MERTENRRHAHILSTLRLTCGRVVLCAMFCIAMFCTSSAWADVDITHGGSEMATRDWSTNYYTNDYEGVDSTFFLINLADDDLTYSGVIRSNYVKVNLGIFSSYHYHLTITKPQQYSGNTTVLDSYLYLSDNGTVGSSDVVLSGACLDFQGTGYGVGNKAFTGNISTGSTSSGARIYYNTNSTTEISGKISGDLSVEVQSGTLQLSNTNTFTNHVKVGEQNNAAALKLSAQDAIADASYVCMPNANSKITISSGDQTIKNLYGDGSIATLAGKKLTLHSTVNHTEGRNYTGTITGGGSVDIAVDSGKIYTLYGTNTYTGTTTVSGEGTLSLSAVNAISASSQQVDLSGDVIINAVGKGVYDANDNCTVSYTICNQKFNNLKGSGNITFSKEWIYYRDDTKRSYDSFNNAWKQTHGGQSFTPEDYETDEPLTLTLNNAAKGGNTTYSGVISGNGNVVKTGAGTLTLTGANSYTGTTTISSGKIVLSGNGTLGTGAVILNGGTLESANAQATTIQTFSGNSSLLVGSSAVTITDAVNQTGGETSLNGGSLTLTNGGTLNNLNGSGTLNIGAALTLNANSATPKTFVGSISANGLDITKTGKGTLKIKCVNSDVFAAGLLTLEKGELDILGSYTGDLALTGGVFSAGNSIGTLEVDGTTTMGDNAQILMEIGGTNVANNDSFKTTTLSLTDGAKIVLQATGTAALQEGDAFEAKFDAGNSASLASDFISKYVQATYFSDLQYELSDDGYYVISGTYAGPSIVPEPGTWALLLLGLFGMGMYKRRKAIKK